MRVIRILRRVAANGKWGLNRLIGFLIRDCFRAYSSLDWFSTIYIWGMSPVKLNWTPAQQEEVITCLGAFPKSYFYSSSDTFVPSDAFELPSTFGFSSRYFFTRGRSPAI